MRGFWTNGIVLIAVSCTYVISQDLEDSSISSSRSYGRIANWLSTKEVSAYSPTNEFNLSAANFFNISGHLFLATEWQCR